MAGRLLMRLGSVEFDFFITKTLPTTTVRLIKNVSPSCQNG